MDGMAAMGGLLVTIWLFSLGSDIRKTAAILADAIRDRTRRERGGN